jgi:hypothetical protein
MGETKFILLQDSDEPNNTNWNYVIEVEERDLEKVKEIISDADVEYEETDRDEYFIGFLRQKLTELGYIDKVKITVEHEFFSAYMVY